MNSGWDGIELGEPTPLPSPRIHAPIEWPAGSVLALPEADAGCTVPFGNVVRTRRTRREFAPLDLPSLSALLSLTLRVQQSGDTSLGFPITRRPVPSAGAIHPVHLLLIEPAATGWRRYDPFGHALVDLPTSVAPATVRSAMERIVPAPQATLMVFAAEFASTGAKYADPASLVWRDAGVLQGCLALAAQALGLSFCLLGATGDPWVRQLLDQRGLAGVGTAFVGAAP